MERKEAEGKEVLGVREEVVKERCVQINKEEEKRIKSCLYESKDEKSEQLGMKISQGVSGCRLSKPLPKGKSKMGKMKNWTVGKKMKLES